MHKLTMQGQGIYRSSSLNFERYLSIFRVSFRNLCNIYKYPADRKESWRDFEDVAEKQAAFQDMALYNMHKIFLSEGE